MSSTGDAATQILTILGIVFSALGAIFMGGQHTEGEITKFSNALEKIALYLVSLPKTQKSLTIKIPWPYFFLVFWLGGGFGMYRLVATLATRISAEEQWSVLKTLIVSQVFVGIAVIGLFWLFAKGQVAHDLQPVARKVFLSVGLITIPFTLLVAVITAVELGVVAAAYFLVTVPIWIFLWILEGTITAVRKLGESLGYRSFLQQVGLGFFVAGALILIIATVRSS